MGEEDNGDDDGHGDVEDGGGGNGSDGGDHKTVRSTMITKN